MKFRSPKKRPQTNPESGASAVEYLMAVGFAVFLIPAIIQFSGAAAGRFSSATNIALGGSGSGGVIDLSISGTYSNPTGGQFGGGTDGTQGCLPANVIRPKDYIDPCEPPPDDSHIDPG